MRKVANPQLLSDALHDRLEFERMYDTERAKCRRQEEYMAQFQAQVMNQGEEIARLMRLKKAREDELRTEREERMEIERVLVAIKDSGVTPTLPPALVKALKRVSQMSSKVAIPAHPGPGPIPPKNPDVEMH